MLVTAVDTPRVPTNERMAEEGMQSSPSHKRRRVTTPKQVQVPKKASVSLGNSPLRFNTVTEKMVENELSKPKPKVSAVPQIVTEVSIS